MSVPTRVVHKRRATVTELPLYYSGHLLKKLTKEKDFKKYYGELRGATLFLYKDDTQDTYTEKLDLEKLTSMKLDSPYKRKAPTIFTLTLHTEEVQLKMDNSDTGEEWRGYILTVVKKKIPSELQLLPGQMLLLQEALDQERKRKPPMAPPPLPPRPSFLPSPSASLFRPLPTDKPGHNSPDTPACFYSVTRQEAEQMLEANPENGGIILRPSTLANNYALTLRQLTPSGPVMKNYRVACTNSGFVIELDTAVMVSSLNEVLKYFLEKTEYRLRPYVASQPYDTRIDVSPAPKCVSITSPTPKTVPKAQVAPMLRSENKAELLLPPTKEEAEYVIPNDHSPDHNLRIVQLDGELRDVLKFRRENIYTASDNEEVTTYENQTIGKSPSGTAQWATWSAAV
ncbi:signal-transducing adaptor protein 1-like [Etheostoma cragini]|uniref:signal-transducing adaptor protein 1-like n=1 Tax=Etheostoma cragini TaxID=417921 RepID=UPI00155E23D3|nr:signal-transducing adaptor protein 1-like [Etheostoma cragini]XP_034739870.1 signal-transducing adaptor protein 1-like [Etheostoma cragini]